MQSSFYIIPPHKDIRKGQFDEAVFAADLGDIAAGCRARVVEDGALDLRPICQSTAPRIQPDWDDVPVTCLDLLG
ncbi:MAG: hypothetical protein JXM73_22220 [Anaerolineae bacterium]|nr:hypothetical protein [Anaerolineae bacterium]